MNILQLNTSIFSGSGQSSRLADQLVTRLLAQHPGATLAIRNLAHEPVPHLDAERFAAFTSAARTPAQQAVIDYSDQLIDELRRADTLVLGLQGAVGVYAEGLAIGAERANWPSPPPRRASRSLPRRRDLRHKQTQETS